MNRRNLFGLLAALPLPWSLSWFDSRPVGYLRYRPGVIDDGEKLVLTARVSSGFGEDHSVYAIGAIKGDRGAGFWSDQLHRSMGNTLGMKYSKLILPDGSEYTNDHIEAVRQGTPAG